VTAGKAALPAEDGAGSRMIERGEALLQETYLGLPAVPAQLPQQMQGAADGAPSYPIEQLFEAFEAAIGQGDGGPPPVKTITDPSIFVNGLLKPRVPQALDTLRLPRSLAQEFAFGRDTTPQMLIGFAPTLRDSFYEAWENAEVNAAETPLQSVSVFRVNASLFGSAVSRMATYDDHNRLNTPDKWDEWTIDPTEDAQTL